MPTSQTRRTISLALPIIILFASVVRVMPHVENHRLPLPMHYGLHFFAFAILTGTGGFSGTPQSNRKRLAALVCGLALGGECYESVMTHAPLEYWDIFTDVLGGLSGGAALATATKFSRSWSK